MNIYEKLHLKTVVNAFGTITRYGGSLMHPSVRQSMVEAGEHFVDMDEYHKAAGAYIAKLVGAEACCITCGADAGLAIAAAAVMAGENHGFKYQLPDTTGMKNEFLVLQCHRNLYDQAILLSGAKFVEVGRTAKTVIEEVENAITDRTAAFFYSSESETMRGSLPLEEIAPVCRKHNIPIIVDAAAELPPRVNLTRFHERGADLVVFSGGKQLRGPQATGLILGKKDLISACDFCTCPHHGVGRSMKVDKENIAGIVAAVELFMQVDEEAQNQKWADTSRKMAELIKGSDRAEVRLGYPVEPGVQPVDILRVYVKPLKITVDELEKRLLAHDPAVCAHNMHKELVLNPQCLEEGEYQIVAQAILDCL